MSLTQFLSYSLATIFVITLAWPLNVPLIALAYKVRLGPNPVPLDWTAYWLRSAFAALGLAALSLVLCGVGFLLVWLGLPELFVAPLVFMAYLPAAAWYVFWMFALDELLEGLSVLGIYLLLPGVPLFLLGLFTGLLRSPFGGSLR